MATDEIDLGMGFKLRFAKWAPDRSIKENRLRYAFIPDVEKISGILTCAHGIEGSIFFDHGPKYREIFNGPWWTVESWEPLTISPSIQTGCCHGFIRNGKWQPA
jgi:hypothetical protein